LISIVYSILTPCEFYNIVSPLNVYKRAYLVLAQLDLFALFYSCFILYLYVWSLVRTSVCSTIRVRASGDLLRVKFRRHELCHKE